VLADPPIAIMRFIMDYLYIQRSARLGGFPWPELRCHAPLATRIRRCDRVANPGGSLFGAGDLHARSRMSPGCQDLFGLLVVRPVWAG
jgi:hypothetical protein